ncbi:UNVERIFIED_CONTAM: hypothetical protein GTU68_064611 [Idotea baltica]|nr:hypothetical protein [Idotea baltica]
MECEVGDELGRRLNSDTLGRIAAQTAKQVIVQKLRDAERDNIHGEYKDRKGEIVNGIVQRFERELRGERIDIVTWTPDPPSFVARALSPADVVRVVVDEDDHAMEVVVGDDQLSLAIGRRGQNVRLATKLTGWRIDVRSESIAEEESKRARQALESIPGIGLAESELLYQEGYRSVQEVATASPDDLMAIEGVDASRVGQILEGSRALAAELRELEISSGGEVEDENLSTDLDQLILPHDVRESLVEAGFDSIQSLAGLSSDEVVTRTGMEAEQALVVVSATESFLRVQEE